MTDKEIAALNAEIDEEFAFGLYLEERLHKTLACNLGYIGFRFCVFSALDAGFFAAIKQNGTYTSTNEAATFSITYRPYAVANKIAALMMKLPPRERLATFERINAPGYVGADISQNKKPAE